MPENRMLIYLDAEDKATRKIDSSLTKIKKQGTSTTKTLMKNWAKLTLVLAGTAIALKKIIDVTQDLVAQSSKMETWTVQMETFTKNTDEAALALKRMIEFSVKTPFTPE